MPPLLVSAKDLLQAQLPETDIATGFRQIELWSNGVTLDLPPPVTTGGFQSFLDNLGDLWVAAPGVNNGNWRRASDVLYSSWGRGAAWTTSNPAAKFNFDTVVYDPYTLYVNGTGWTVPIAGVYNVQVQLAFTSTAAGQWMEVDLTLAGSTYALSVSSIADTTGRSTYTQVGGKIRTFAAGNVIYPTQLTNTAGLAGVTGAIRVYGSLSYLGSG